MRYRVHNLRGVVLNHSPLITLRGYWRSSATWRVRIALYHKSIPFNYVPIHLVKDGGEQHSAEQIKRNPLAQVPTLELEDGSILTQSLAIIDYLESLSPLPSVYPTQALDRARALQYAEIINSGIQPLQNLSLLLRVQSLGADKLEWGKEYIAKGLNAIESDLATRTPSKYLVGEQLSIADFCLIPQLYNARRFKVDLEDFPRLCQVEAQCEKLSAFKRAHPDAQQDAQP